MSITKHIGKNTLGDNNKMKVNLRTYNRSTHDLSYVWRNTQAVGTLVPFLCEPVLPDDTNEISINANVLTHPTVGPLFGSFKLQCDLFVCPIRLYNAMLHNNALNVGLDMAKVKFPMLEFALSPKEEPTEKKQEFKQISTSSLLAYLGTRGLAGGINNSGSDFNVPKVKKNAIPLIAYYDIFKNYYANKQEEKFYTIDAIKEEGTATITRGGSVAGIVNIPYNKEESDDTFTLKNNDTVSSELITERTDLLITYTLTTGMEKTATLKQIAVKGASEKDWIITNITGTVTIQELKLNDSVVLKEQILEDIDEMRELILSMGREQLIINEQNSKVPELYKYFAPTINNENPVRKTGYPQYGLAVKTYQSDIFNNWINTEWIDGENGINAITAIDTSSGSFNIDTFYLAKKVYEMLNRIAVSGGTYQDWIQTVYTNQFIDRTETPIYQGGMSQEIVFQEVVSNSATEDEPLGTLAGRGVLSEQSKKGGILKIKVQEPSYLIGICSITPRIDYYQGNSWHVDLETMNDLHKPALDGIGFQDLICNQMAYWTDSAIANSTGTIINKQTVGKQPAWINYMTNYNKVYGNFAIENSEMFMVLTRKYQQEYSTGATIKIKNLTTYIDPADYIEIFADQSLKSMNFWVQLGVSWRARRKMSAKQMPNL